MHFRFYKPESGNRQPNFDLTVPEIEICDKGECTKKKKKKKRKKKERKAIRTLKNDNIQID